MASLLTVALHGKLEYFTDILKTLLNDLVEQYVAKNPKLMLRRCVLCVWVGGWVGGSCGLFKCILTDGKASLFI